MVEALRKEANYLSATLFWTLSDRALLTFAVRFCLQWPIRFAPAIAVPYALVLSV